MTRGTTRRNKAVEDTGARLRLPSRGPGDTTRHLIARVPTATPPFAPPSSPTTAGAPIPPTALIPRPSILPSDERPSAKMPLSPRGPRMRSAKRQRPLGVRLIAVGAVVVTALATFGLNTIQALQEQEVTSPDGPQAALVQSIFGGTPSASGHAPPGAWSATAASVTVLVPQTAGEPCHDIITFPKVIDQWMAPPGCYGNIFRPNPANYPPRPGFGWCNWWVRVNHPDHLDITENHAYPSGSVPHAGDAVFFDGGVQGADRAGHWAQVVAVDPDNYWVLISEMNFAWRGAGWARVDYRYIHVGPGVHFIYA